MLTSLRGRLLASYLLLLLITLAVTAGVLIILLSSRLAPPEQVYFELMTIARTLNVRDGLGDARPRLPRQRDDAEDNATLADTLATYAEEVGVRLMIVNPQTRAIIMDSDGTYSPNDTLPFTANPPPERNPDTQANGGPPILNYQTGHFRNPDDSEWLFISYGLAIERRNGEALTNQRILMLAAERPTTSLIRAIDQFSSELSIALLQAGAVGAVVATVLAVIISRNTAKPLQDLSRVAGAVAEGDYAQRVPVVGPSEIKDVAHAFNRMSEQVELNNQAQRDLLANVSHDLKTPLTSIQGFSQAIMDGTAPNAQHAAGIIFEEAGRLARLVSMLTELTRLQAGRLTMRQEALDVGEIVGAMVQKVDVVAQRKQVRLQAQIQPVPTVKGDGDRLAQVVNNLLSNAVKYTPAGGQVLTKVEAYQQGVRLIVKDTGIGIPHQDISRIFERFYQVDKSRTGRKRGHGLGLAITHEIIVAHGGQIMANSEGEGMGTTFTVWLPTA